LALALIASPRDLDLMLSRTVLGRRGFERQLATVAEQARALAWAQRPDIILVDVYLEGALELVEGLRADAETQGLSIVALTGRTTDPREAQLLRAGANAVLRLPPDSAFDERLMRYVDVPMRKSSRFPVSFRIKTGGQTVPASGLNISLHGLLIETWAELPVSAEVLMTFRLGGEGGAMVSAQGRVVRRGAPRQYGVEFMELDLNARLAIETFVLG
jgi:CheY-like chemotaxis protein